MDKTTYWSMYKKRMDIIGPIIQNIAKRELECPIVDVGTLADTEAEVMCVGVIRALNTDIPGILEERPSYKVPDYSYYEANDIVREDTVYILEDMSGTVVLKLESIRDANYVPGCVVGVVGHMENGEFVQKRVIHPIIHEGDGEITEQGPITHIDGTKKIIFINELNLDTSSAIGLMSVILDNLRRSTYGEIQEIVILGTVVRRFTDSRYTTALLNEHDIDIKLSGNKLLNTHHETDFGDSIRIIDQIFTRILSHGISIVVLPGIEDPTSLSLPQMAISRKLFPKAAKYDTFRTIQSPTTYHIRRSDGQVNILLDNGVVYKFLKRVLPRHTPEQRLQIWYRSSHLLPIVPAIAWGSPFLDESSLILKIPPQLILTSDGAGIYPMKQSLVLESRKNTYHETKRAKASSTPLHAFLPSFAKSHSFVVFCPLNNELTTITHSIGEGVQE